MSLAIGRQILAVVRLEFLKTLFGRRGLWIYLLALAPALLFLGHSIYAPREQRRLARIATAHPLSPETLAAIHLGMSRTDVLARLGQPYFQHTWRHRAGRRGFREHVFYKYTDGRSDYDLHFENGKLRFKRRIGPDTLAKESVNFATIFQFYYLRIAIFFGCVGIFMNLFRGEMLDKSLHFYLLTPIRREVLVAGKFLAGLLATGIIFTIGTSLQWAAMLHEFSGAEISHYFAGTGWHELGAYLGVTVLACAGYGSLFLAAGLFFRNPIIPAAGVLLWESANWFLPVTLKHLSVIFYLQALCPVVAAPEHNLPPLLQLLIAVAKPPSHAVALSGIAIFTIFLVVVAGWRARKLEIQYGTD